ncbi:hypothetical protein AVEN_241570-1 [Araneus ventricosus]|uniref:Uncharacterized protein n=1 Tax=Araneus ventricosus TaxID=182803 RepID=A0A4Y2H9S4_ARAVE|nr:hypothetical protein AVEN_241570-1 [Araneus ventricosus]
MTDIGRRESVLIPRLPITPKDLSSQFKRYGEIENFQISSDFTPHKNFKLRKNTVTNLSSSGHMSANFPVPGTPTNETSVFPEIVQPCPKAIMKGIRKTAESTSTHGKQN